MMDLDEAIPLDEFVALARDEGLIALEVQVVQTPGEGNGHSAVVQVTARSAEASFSAIGEASPRSAPADWHPFLATLAELRGKARALREITGLEHVLQEELSAPYVAARPPVERSAPARPVPPANGSAGRPAVTPIRPEGKGGPSPVQEAAAALEKLQRRTTPPVEAANAADDSAGADDEDGAEPDEEVTAPRPAAHTSSPAPSSVADAPSSVSPSEGAEPTIDGIGRDMEAKLLKLATSIAELEGEELSEAQARRKLDDFFLRAFKHPLNRATRIEGQRVVQRLSGDLARRRIASNDDKD